MASNAVVIGEGPGAEIAAAALVRLGRNVTLLRAGSGYPHRDIPVGRGVTTRPGDFAAAILGPFREVASAADGGLDRGLLLGGKVRALPLSRAEVAALFPATRMAGAGVAWARTRGTLELKKLIGGGSEQRTYRDWIAQRFGQPAFERLHAEYCRKRFGDPADVSCNVARLFHGAPDDSVRWVPAGAARLEGVTVRDGVTVQSIRGDRVSTDAGEFEGQVFVAVAPTDVVRWLDSSVAMALENDVASLGVRDAVQVLVRGPQRLPFETHVLDGDVPFYRIVRPGVVSAPLGGTLAVHYSLAPSEPDPAPDTVVADLARVGVEGAEAAGARVQRVPGQHPVWVGTHLARMRRYVLALEELGIVPVGRPGLHSPIGLAEEIAYVEAAAAEDRPSLRELLRVHAEPPVMDPVERARLTEFVAR